MIEEKLLEQARQVNLKNYLEASGYKLYKDSSKNGFVNYKVENREGLIIREDGKWWDFCKNEGGKAVDFLVKQEGIEFKKAVAMLVDIEPIARREISQKLPQAKLELPERAENDRRVFAYLLKERGIKKEILEPLVKAGLIYETNERHNVVFLGKNPKGEIKYCFQRSTLTSSGFKGDVAGSDKSYNFHIKGSNNTLYVYESAIDLLSHASLQSNLGNTHRLALGCTGQDSLNQYLKDYPEIKKITLCLDNDATGRKRIKVLGNELKEKGYEVYAALPKEKDWNEELKKNLTKEVKLVKQKQIEISK